MEPYTVNEIPPSEVLKSTLQQRKKRIIIICSIIAAVIVYYVIYYVFDFDIVGDLLLEFM
jgi:cytochrome bd-type quinol oxidase subunit 1